MTLNLAGASRGQFTQQGSVDWLQLANHMVTIPLSILERLAGADLSPHTILVAQNLSSIFYLSEVGTERLESALQSLHSCSSVGEVVWFGFGIKHVVRRLAEIRQGLACIALCGALSELHPSKACASILMELSHACDVPDEVRPSPQQWINIVETCSGVLRPTTFRSVAGQFMAFHGRDRSYGSIDNYKDIAAALQAVGRVSSGSLESITLAGGRSCGWIAAFGFWFLGLHVRIQNSEGEVLYSSTDLDFYIKIVVIYGDSQTSQVQVQEAAYFIKTLHDIFFSSEERFDSVMSGSVPWNTCFRSTFGSSALELIKYPEDFGRLICLSSRIFDGISKSEPSEIFNRRSRQSWFGFQPRQRGKRFVWFANDQFPELSINTDQMEESSTYTLDRSVAEYNLQLHKISVSCTCRSCTKGSTQHSYCHPILAETIIFLVWNLAGIQIHRDLQPFRSGLQSIYELVADEEDESPDSMSRASQIPHRSGIEHLISLLGMGSVYHTAQYLFTTNLYPQTITAFTAASTGGLCFYFNILVDVSDQPEIATLLHVVPGRIETKGGRKYAHVLDITGRSSVGILGLEWIDNGYFILPAEYSKTYQSQNPQPLSGLENDLTVDTGSGDLEATLVIKESSQGLHADFIFRCSRGSSRVGAYMLFREIAFSSGLVTCNRRNCLPLSPPYDNIVVVDGEGGPTEEPRQNAIYIYRLSSNSLARCVGLLVGKEDWEAPVILRGLECIPCCIVTAMQLGHRPVYVIL
ncbi:hypothetical protein BGZ60DRAFT_431165 [Tricladium varicosporioides]|nr:hypothetical protein BGZ60DRAFT_431165 [Hymenoscyphus varicosporioides]